jgi:hypothetical protein
VENLSASLVSVDGYRYSFLILLDGKPYSGSLSARLDNSSMVKDYDASEDGLVVIPADVSSGEHVFRLVAENQEMDVPYGSAQASLSDFYLQYGGLALLIGAALYVLLRRPSGKKYLVTVPDLSDPDPAVVRLGESEFMKIFEDVQKQRGWSRTPLSAAEIRLGIKTRFAKSGMGLALTDSNVSDILERLEKKGLVKSWNGYSAPAKWIGKESIRFHVVRRMVRDRLIANGFAFSDRGNFFEVEDRVGKAFYHIHNESDSRRTSERVLRSTKKGKCVLVFSDAAEMSQFTESLGEYDKAKIRMGMEIRHNRIKLLTVDEIGA